ncbi:hypothetical protein [Dickeya undicola]|nr:hypothetical protein [Dickeya undicola]
MKRKYALIKNGSHYVENVIVADENFVVPDYYLIEISDDKPAQPGTYYNAGDGKFYGDEAYSTDYLQQQPSLLAS